MPLNINGRPVHGKNFEGSKMKSLSSKIVLTTLTVAFSSIASFAFAAEADNIPANPISTQITGQIAPSAAPAIQEQTPQLFASLSPIVPGRMAASSSTEMYELAGQFSALVSESRRAAQGANLNSARAIAQSVDRSPRLTRASTIDGAKAYAVLAALRSNDFKAAVIQSANEMGRDAFIAKITSDASAIRRLNGYAEAKNFASSALNDAYSTIGASSEIIRQASYDLQREQWSMVVQAKQPRLEAVAVSWNAPISGYAIEASNVAVNARANEPVNDKILVAAALSAINDHQDAILALGRDSGKFCANRAYLNLRQCLAATRYAYEHTFCLSRHGYADFNDCAQSATR